MSSLIPLFLVLLIVPLTTFAVPPPDFIIQAVSQIAVFLTLGFAFLSSIFFTFRQYFRAHYPQYKRIILLVGLLFCISLII